LKSSWQRGDAQPLSSVVACALLVSCLPCYSVACCQHLLKRCRLASW
jgi:hypothetical protein